MLTIGAYRDISQESLHGSDLFYERVNDELAKAASGLSTFLAGCDFAEDILRSLDPQIAAIVTSIFSAIASHKCESRRLQGSRPKQDAGRPL